MLFANTRRFLFQKKVRKMPLATSLQRRLETMKDAVALQLLNRKVIGWFQDRTAHVDADKLMNSDLFSKVYADFTNLLNQLQAQVAVIRQDNRITLSEAVSFIGSAIQQAYLIVNKYAATPTDRKDLVLMLVDEFYAKVLAPLDIPYVPSVVENTFLDPMIGKGLHYAVDGLYDVIVNAIHTTPPLPASNIGSPSPNIGSANPNS